MAAEIINLPARDIRSSEAKAWDEFNAAREKLAAEWPFPTEESMLRYIAAQRAWRAEYLKNERA